MQKWPKTITAIRHVRSAYNDLNKEAIPGYQEFAEQFDREYATLDLAAVVSSHSLIDRARRRMKGLPPAFPSLKLKRMAIALAPALESQTSDYETDIAIGALEQAITTGSKLSEYIELPDVIYVSPYKRTRRTLEGLIEGWPELGDVRAFEDHRIREQEHGKRIAYTDWRLYFVFNPDQALLNKRSTKSEYKHDQGESHFDVQDRWGDFAGMLIREHGGKKGGQEMRQNGERLLNQC